MRIDISKNPAPVSSTFERKTMFQIEADSTEIGVARLLEECGNNYKMEIIRCAFASERAMIPVPPNLSYQYPDGMPRGRLGVVLSVIPAKNRRVFLAFAIQLVDWQMLWAPTSVFVDAAKLLMHNPIAGNIMKDIWRKWDVNNDIPLPAGVQRVWNGETKKSEVLYVKTRLPYLS